MALNKKQTTTKRATSTSKASKKIIRDEIRMYYASRRYGVRSSLDAMKKDADNRKYRSNYQKGASLVDGGRLAYSHSDQAIMLGKIYGKKNVETWSGDKIHNTYKHLIGREYEAMLNEQAKKKAQAKAKREQAKRTAQAKREQKKRANAKSRR